MPELPEVETVRRSLEDKVTGLKIKEVLVLTPQVARSGVFSNFADTLAGRQFVSFERRGKYLMAHLDGGMSLVVHLRMTGRWVYCPAEVPVPKHTHIIFRLDNGRELRFTDVRRFGGIEIVETEEIALHSGLKKLGVEPLGPDFTVEYMLRIFKDKKVKIKSLILDQTKLAGLGNIYADEALFRAGIHPEKLAGEISRNEALRLHQAIQQVLAEGIANKGTTFRDYVDGEGQQGTNQLNLKVYGRKGQECSHCGTQLGTIKVGGRTSVFCPRCQV